MRRFQSWLNQKKFELHLIAFIMMVMSPIGMYFAAQGNASGSILLLLWVVILANLLVMIAP